MHYDSPSSTCGQHGLIKLLRGFNGASPFIHFSEITHNFVVAFESLVVFFAQQSGRVVCRQSQRAAFCRFQPVTTGRNRPEASARRYLRNHEESSIKESFL